MSPDEQDKWEELEEELERKSNQRDRKHRPKMIVDGRSNKLPWKLLSRTRDSDQ